MKALYLPAPERYIGVDPCTKCQGKRITSERRTTALRPTFLVDVFCSECGGCGRSEHEDCDITMHADIDRGEWPEDLFEIERDCGACSDRGWWACQAFNDDTVLFLRMPCGCAEPLLFEVDVADAE